MAQRPSRAEDLSIWSSVDAYYEQAVGAADPALSAVVVSSRSEGLPEIQVSPLQGRCLQLLARAVSAARILEIGTLGGYSAIWLARALPPGGRLTTLELDPKHATIARANLDRAGLSSAVEVVVGPAADTLARLQRERVPPFDFTFIDADKESYREYLEASLRLSRPGSLIVADNVVRRGDVRDPKSPDPAVQGIRRMTDWLGHRPELVATVLQTVGAKGHDGWLMALVVGDVSGSPGRGRAPPRGASTT